MNNTRVRTNIEDMENLETFYLVCLGDSIKNEIRQQFRAIINHLSVFEDEQQFIQYINSLSKHDQVILIIKRKQSQHIVPKIMHLPQIVSVYIHSNDKNANEKGTKNFNKIHEVFVQRNELLQRIRKDFNRRQFYNFDEPLSMNFFNSKKTDEKFVTTALNDYFIHSQILIDCLMNTPSLTNDKSQLIALCKQQYKNNSDELSIVEEFEKDYSPERSLWWYTRHSFLYRLLNKAFRMQNMDLLLVFRFFIRDLRQQLIKNKSTSFVRTYRGQLMYKEDLELVTKFSGEFISLNSFLLASPDYEQTRSSLLSIMSSDSMEKVLFEINATPESDHNKALSNVTPFGYSRNKEEFSFMIGSIFRLVRIDRDINGIWHIQLNLCANNDHLLQSIIEQKKNEFDIVESDLLSIGFLLEHMGKLDDAEKYYHYLLSQLSNDHEDISRCYHALGEVTQKKGVYDESLKWYNKSIENDTKQSPEDNPNIATTFNSIAVVYSKKGDYTLALESYKKALEIWIKTEGEDHPDVAMCHNNMGIILQEQDAYADALECYHKSWNIRQKILPIEHPSLGQSHACIGNIHYRLKNYDLALEHYNISLEAFEKSYLSHHPDVAMVLKSMALVCYAKNEFQLALVYLEKAMTIYRQSFPATHPHVIQTEKDIRFISSKL